MSRFSHLLAVPLIAATATIGTLAGLSDSAAAAETYTVRSGDSLGRIAYRLDVPLGDLLSANQLTISSVIHPGQQLIVPGAGGSSGESGGTTSGSTYVVKPGDWLARIAQRHGVPLTALLSANDLTATSLILPGQRLIIPGAAGSGGAGTNGGAAASGATYVVKPGDWLARIARRHGVSLAALLSANDLTATSLILPGQRLTIPGAGSPAGGTTSGGTVAAPTSGGSTYVVRAGDYLAGIASKHGVSLNALLAANQLSMTSLILPGQSIRVPGGGGTPASAAPSRGTSINSVLNYALAQVGKPWRFFSRGPNAFDCSGLTAAAYGQVGVSLIQQSAFQARQGSAVDFRNQPIRAGDLVFQDTNGDGVINHVGIALGNGNWVQARSRRTGVTVGRLPSNSSIVAVRRILTS